MTTSGDKQTLIKASLQNFNYAVLDLAISMEVLEDGTSVEPSEDCMQYLLDNKVNEVRRTAYLFLGYLDSWGLVQWLIAVHEVSRQFPELGETLGLAIANGYHYIDVQTKLASGAMSPKMKYIVKHQRTIVTDTNVWIGTAHATLTKTKGISMMNRSFSYAQYVLSRNVSKVSDFHNILRGTVLN